MKTSEGRYVYLDNIRNMLVFAVVLFHAVCMFAYPLVFYWPVIDREGSSRAYETVIFTMDIFMMPVLFFIAALFILPSLRAGSAPGYVKKRFRRLIVPLLVFTFCAGDIYHAILLKRLGVPVSGYGRIFMDYWRNFLDEGAITFIGSTTMMHQVSFNLLHLWFLGLLFSATLVVVALHGLSGKKERNPGIVNSRNTIIVKTVLFALVAGVVYAALSIGLSLAGVELNSWMRVFWLIQVRVNQFWMLLPLFLFGLYMGRKGWLARGDIGSWKMWGAISLVVLCIIVIQSYTKYLPMLEPFIRAYEHNMLFTEKAVYPAITEEFQQVFTLVNLLLLPGCIFILMFLLAFAKRFFNSPNAVTAFCSKHSINVYILHYIPVIFLQYGFMKMGLPPAVTIAAAVVIVIPACLWLSHRLVYPYPAAAILFFAVLKVTALFAGFEFYYIALTAVLVISFLGAVVESTVLMAAVRSGRRGLPETSEDQV